ncbi:MAG: hypothetical protein WC869_11835 [Phycisphaerae bacterium]|jgi:hypothetical protein
MKINLFGYEFAVSLTRIQPACNLVRHAEEELRRAGLFDADSDYGGMMGPAVLNMVRQFSDEGHSGYSAGLAIAAFKKVAAFEPLTPLTGDDSEWVEYEPGQFQNRRCSHVFKTADGAYDIDGRIFREPDGACFTNGDSRVPVTFPYTPKREYIDVPAAAE